LEHSLKYNEKEFYMEALCLCTISLLGGAMTRITISVHINQPPDVVTGALMEPENFVQWTSNLERFEVVKGEAGEAGALARLHYVEQGRSYVMEDFLEYVEPGRKYVSRVTGNGMRIRVETLIDPLDDGTQMTLTWSGTSDNWLAKLLLPFLRGQIKRYALVDLETFKSLVETHGVRFSSGT
jgi:hypothetical protein